MSSIAIDREGFLANVLLAQKGPCRVGTTGSIVLSGEQTIDGVAVVADDRVLVKDQTIAKENAIYAAKTGEWELAQDFDQRGHVVKGTKVLVTDGTVNALTDWYVTTTGRPWPGREAIAFAQLSASEISGLTPTDGNIIVGNGTTWVAESGATAQRSLGVREVLTAARTYYLRADGSDSNDGLADTAAGAWRTPQHAMTELVEALDFAGNNITVEVADGTYDALYVPGSVGHGYIEWNGNQTTPANVVFRETNSLAGPVLDVEQEGGANIHTFKGIQFQNASGAGSGERRVAFVGRRNRVQFEDCNFITNTSDARLLFADKLSLITVSGTTVFTSNGGTEEQIIASGGEIIISGTLTVNGLDGGWGHMRAARGGRIEYYPSSVTVSGSPALVVAFAVASEMGYIESSVASFSGSATGVRAIVERNSFINTFGSGATYFPGNSGPTGSEGGIYRHSDGTLIAFDPVLVGGSAASSTLTLKATSGVGTSDAIIFQVGNNGATEGGRFATGGQLIFGHTASVAAFGFHSPVQLHGHGAAAGLFGPTLFEWDNSAVGPFVDLNKSRGGTPGTRGIVQSGDNLGIWDCAGDDGTNFIQSVTLQARVDGTPGTNDMPGRLEVRTTPDGGSASIERVRVTSRGMATFWGEEVATASTSVTPSFTNVPVQAHVGSVTDNVSGFFYWFADAFGPLHSFYKSRGGLNVYTVVQSGDILGGLDFYGADGTDAALGASIRAHVDGTPGNNDMPSRLSFRTSADGSASPTERMRINALGDVSIGIAASASGQLHVDQASTTGAQPVLYLDQADIDQPFATLATTIGTGNAIEAVGAKTLTTTHFVMVNIDGVGNRYIPVGTIA